MRYSNKNYVWRVQGQVFGCTNLETTGLGHVRVGASALATESSHDVHETRVVLDAFLSTADRLLLFLLLLDLRGLTLDLSGTSQRTVNLTHIDLRKYKEVGMNDDLLMGFSMDDGLNDLDDFGLDLFLNDGWLGDNSL